MRVKRALYSASDAIQTWQRVWVERRGRKWGQESNAMPLRKPRSKVPLTYLNVSSKVIQITPNGHYPCFAVFKCTVARTLQWNGACVPPYSPPTSSRGSMARHTASLNTHIQHVFTAVSLLNDSFSVRATNSRAFFDASGAQRRNIIEFSRTARPLLFVFRATLRQWLVRLHASRSRL